MKTNASQIFDDEILMEIADHSLPSPRRSEIISSIRNSVPDEKTLEEFRASAVIMDLLRAEIRSSSERARRSC
jgi:hypothetical protein